MESPGPPDVVGYEWDMAEELLVGAGFRVDRMIIGDGTDEGPLRVVRQQQSESVIKLTCARENWSHSRRS